MTRKTWAKAFCGLAFLGILSACGSPGTGAPIGERDRLEGFNRFFHGTNVRLDQNIIRPVAQGYDYVTPEVIQHMLTNAYSHINTVGDFANYLFQGDIDAALVAGGRFTINTIIGAGGLLDPASEFDLPKEDTDFGITLGKWGVGEGSYLVLPLIGPTTTRDASGGIVDRALDPRTYISVFVDGTIVDVALPAATVLEVVEARDRNADLIDEILYNSADSYVSLRSIYLQRRDSQILGDEGTTDQLPDIFDDETQN